MLRLGASLFAAALTLLVTSTAFAQGNLVVWWNKGFYPAEDAALQVVIDKWEKKTGGKVELSMFALEDVPRRTIAALEAGSPPDVAFGWLFDFTQSPRWAFEGRLEDVSDIVNPYKDKLFPVAIENVTLLNGKTNSRSIYAVPIFMQTQHVHYWRDMLADAGLKESDIPKTWKEFWNFWCDKAQPAVRAKTGQRNIYGAGSAMSSQASDTYYAVLMFLNVQGVKIIDANGKLTVDDPKVRQGIIAALDDYSSTFKRGCTPPGSASWGDADNNNNFHNRTLIMTMNPSLSIPGKHLDDKNMENYLNKIATIEWPDPPGRQIEYPVAVKQAVIFNNAKNKAGAKAFLATLLETDNIRAYTQGSLGRWFPARKDLAEEAYYTDGKDPHRKVAQKQYAERPLQAFPQTYNYKFAAVQAENLWGKAIGRMVLENWTTDKAVDELIGRMKELVN
jgi:multiple sugar transport system substrate-binding protein